MRYKEWGTLFKLNIQMKQDRQALALEQASKIMKLQIELADVQWERDGLKMVVEKLHKEIEEQDKEIKNLKSDLGYSRTLLDNVSAEYKSQVNINKKLKAELDKYKNDIIYEEWLYD